MKIGVILVGFACVSMAFGGDVKAPTVVNIVNFVRGCEPRYPDRDLVLPLCEEVKLNTRHHLSNTILLQYDALLRDDLVGVAKSAERDRTEYGVWFELCRQVVEKCGIKWAGRPGWDWEWFVNPGFLMAYEPVERERIIDETFRVFRERFGAYPRVAGSWLLDAHSMGYMAKKYGMDAYCICREQDSTDAYGLHGGYSNGLYYPSKVNAISPAVKMGNAIDVPVFRMLTPDPIYSYGSGRNDRTGFVKSRYPGACTLEPACPSAQQPEVVDWFFRVYTGPGLLGLSYMQTGQENSFGWPGISRGLPYQIRKIADLQSSGRIVVETMGETGRKFKAQCRENIPQTQVALENWSDENYKSVWYNSKYYRVNVFYKEGHLCIRDIHKFCDDYPETFLKNACKKWHCSYFTPPVVDGVMFAKDGETGVAEFGGSFDGMTVATPDDKTLVVIVTRPDGRKPLTITCRENRIDFDMGVTTDDWARAGIKFAGAGCGDFFENLDFPAGSVAMKFEGCRYEMPYCGDLKPSMKGWALYPIKGCSSLIFDR